MDSLFPVPSIWIPRPYGIPPSPPRERRMRRMREQLMDARTYTGRLPASLRECLCYLRGMGGMTGMVSEAGKMAAAFGPMGSAAPAGPDGSGESYANPSAYYKLGDTTDSSGNGLTLNNNNTVTFGAGKINNCASFVRTSNQTLSRGSATGLQAGGSGFDFSFNLWVYNVSGNSGLMAKGPNTAADGEYEVLVYSGNVQWSAGDGGINGMDGGSFLNRALGNGAWHMVTGRFEAGTPTSTMTLRVDNGTDATITSQNDFIQTGTGDFFLGQWGDSSYKLTGSLDSVGIWRKYLLSDSDITALWNSGNGADPV